MISTTAKAETVMVAHLETRQKICRSTHQRLTGSLNARSHGRDCRIQRRVAPELAQQNTQFTACYHDGATGLVRQAGELTPVIGAHAGSSFFQSRNLLAITWAI